MNRLKLAGTVTEIAELRYTQVGIPLQAFTIKHVSQQSEAGLKRRVECDVPAVAMAQLAEQARHLRLGSEVRVAGFLANKNRNSRQLVLHLNALEIIEKGYKDGT